MNVTPNAPPGSALLDFPDFPYIHTYEGLLNAGLERL